MSYVNILLRFVKKGDRFMKVVEALTGFIVESVKDIDEGYRVINSC